MTKKIILILAALLTSLGIKAQQTVKIYKNGQLYKIYNNTPTNRYSVVFDAYVKIGDTKWGTMNLGASSVADSPETAYGDYFAWGEVETYYTSITPRKDEDASDNITWKAYAVNTHFKGEKTGYDSDNYWGKDWDKRAEWNPKPYDDATGTLTADYDAASITLDSQWRTPTQEDYRALYEACGATGSTYTPREVTGNTISERGIYHIDKNTTIDGTHYGVSGFLFVADDSDINSRVFFPAAGRIDNAEFNENKHLNGYYWTSTYNSDGIQQAHCVTMSYEKDDEYINTDDAKQRYLGLTIRPIMK